MKVLRIGDPHVKFNNLEDCEKLMHFIVDIILKYSPDRVEILGDLFHTHYIVRLEVLDFWDAWLDVLSDACDVVVLEGNHDQLGDTDASMGTIRVFKRLAQNKILKKSRTRLRIVDCPQYDGIIAYMPYVHDKAKFVDMANSMASDAGCKVLVCHQTFEGATYENGMYAPDGINLSDLKYDVVISGHIHTYQRFGNLIYPGTMKWDTASDANKEKGIWLYEHDDVTGKIISEELIRTHGVIPPLVSITWIEGQEQLAIPSGARVTIELIGSSEWVNKQKNELKGFVSIKSKITDRARPENRKTGKNLEEFVRDHFEPIEGVSKDELLAYMKGSLNV
jgi:DNA repair exonuclease SbcCD nuclease subunit